MSNTTVKLDGEGFKAYRELVEYLKSKYGRHRGLIGLEVSKAIRLYLQQLKASEGAPQSPQQKSITEKTEESKPIKVTETTKEPTKTSEELTKRIEDLECLKQKVEDLSKEVKATEETVKSLVKTLTNLDSRIDDYIKQRIELRKEDLKPITQKIEDLTHDFKLLFHNTNATYGELKKGLEEVKATCEGLKKKLNEVINFINEKHGEYEGFLSNKKKPVIEPIQ